MLFLGALCKRLHQAVAAEGEAVRLQAGEPGGAGADRGGVGEKAGFFLVLGEAGEFGVQLRRGTGLL